MKQTLKLQSVNRITALNLSSLVKGPHAKFQCCRTIDTLVINEIVKITLD